MLEDLLVQLGDYLPILIEYAVNVLVIFLVGYGSVLLVGRMLGVVKSYKVKNLIASIVMLGFTVFFMTTLYIFDSDRYLILEIITHFFGAILIYVVIGFTLVNRVNEFLDQKVVDIDANDLNKEYESKDKKTSKK